MNILGLLLFVGVLVVLAGVARLARRWRLGRPSTVSFLRGLAEVPRRYLHDVHEVVVRERGAGSMHGFTAGGLLASGAIVLVIGWGGWRSPLAGSALIAAIAAMAIGTAKVAGRRYPRRPRRLSGGAFQILPILFAFYLVTALLLGIGLIVSERLTQMAEVGVGFAVIALAAQVGWGPLKHIIAGTAHLAVHPRPERMARHNPDAAALRPLDLDAPRLGIEKIDDFAWNRLTAFDACIQCGRCEAACPANAAELPLNPKALIQQLVGAMPGGHVGEYNGSPHPPVIEHDTYETPIMIGADGLAHIAPETLWSCTTCRACVYECPMLIEHVDAIVDMRRFVTLEQGHTPAKAAAILADLAETDTLGGRPVNERLDWATDLRLRTLAAGEETDVLLWLGESAFELRGQRTLRSLINLLRKAEVDFAVLGADELDTGDMARRLGDEALFQDLAGRNIATLATRRFNRIVTADPHVLHSLRNEYPEFGGRYDVLHHTTFLAELLDAEKLNPTKSLGGTVTYHDPCYLGRYNGEIASPRAILDRIGVEQVEMERSGMRSSCCGGGGGAPQTDMVGKFRIPDQRMDQARATGARTLAVACPTCAVMLDGVVGDKPAVSDIAELLENAL